MTTSHPLKGCAVKGAMFTRLNKLSRMIAAKPCNSLSEASKLERLIKGLTPAQKRYMALQWPLKDGLPANFIVSVEK